jgi:hypothetical protein
MPNLPCYTSQCFEVYFWVKNIKIALIANPPECPSPDLNKVTANIRKELENKYPRYVPPHCPHGDCHCVPIGPAQTGTSSQQYYYKYQASPECEYGIIANFDLEITVQFGLCV